MTRIPEDELLFHVASAGPRWNDSVVRVTHLPTGLSESSSEYASILRNKKEALRRLTERVRSTQRPVR